MITKWKNGEFLYCRQIVRHGGDANVTRDPKTIATYLRLQAAQACRDGEYEASARLGAAATCINEDARNNHTPRWSAALDILDVVS